MVKSRNSKVRYLLPGRRQNKLPPLEELPCNSFFPTLKQGIDTELEIRIIKGSKFTKLNPNKWTLSLNFLLKLELCFDRRAKLKRVREVRWEFPSGRSRENFPVDEYFKFLLRSDSVLLCHKWKKKNEGQRLRFRDKVSGKLPLFWKIGARMVYTEGFIKGESTEANGLSHILSVEVGQLHKYFQMLLTFPKNLTLRTKRNWGKWAGSRALW